MKQYLSILVLMILPFTALQAQEALSLNDVVKIALEQNQSLRINRYETDRSVSQAKSQLSIILPRVDMSLSGSVSGFYPMLFDTTNVAIGGVNFPLTEPNGEYGDLDWNDRYNLSLNLSQNIWDGGAWWNTLQNARITENLASIQLSSYELVTIYQAKVAFYNYLSTKKLLDVYQENLNTNEYQHQLTIERFKLGAASQNDTLRTRVAIEQSRLQILSGETDLALRSKELNLILGREWDQPLTLREPLWDPVEIPELNAVLNEALSNSPTIQVLGKNEAVAGNNVKIARSAYIPSVGLSASYGNFSTSPGDLLAKDNTSFSTGIGVSWNITDGTRKSRGVEQSRISQKLATENLDLAKRNLRKDLAQILNQMKTLQESVEISVLIQDASAQDLLLAQEQYKVGSISILDVLRISASYEDSKANLIRARYNLKIVEAQLFQLLGRR